jgi:MFS family permease
VRGFSGRFFFVAAMRRRFDARGGSPACILRRMPRAARAAVTVVFFASGASFGSWVARVPALQERVEASPAELGLALFGVAAGAVLSLPFAGVLSVRLGSRTVMRGALLGVAISLPLPALAPSLPLLALAFAAVGASNAALDVAMNAHGVVVEGHYGRPILSSFHASFSLGGLAGAAFGGIAAGLGIGPLPQFLAASGAILAIWAWSASRMLARDVDVGAPGPVFGGVSVALAALAALAFAGMLAEGAAGDWSAVYLNGTLGTGEGAATAAFIAFSLTMTAGRLVGDGLTTRAGPVRLARAAGLAAAGGLALALLTDDALVAVVGFACLGAGLSVVVPTVYRAAGASTGSPGAGIAAVSTVGYGAFLIGPVAIGFVADATSLRAALWLVVALLALIPLLARAVGGRAATGA